MRFVHPVFGPFTFGGLGGLGVALSAGARLTIRIYVQQVHTIYCRQEVHTIYCRQEVHTIYCRQEVQLI